MAYPPIWKRTDLKAIHWKILWWIVDAGCARKSLGYGWKSRCADQLGVSHQTILRAVGHMIEVGVMKHAGRKGDTCLNPPAFASHATIEGVQIR